MTEQATPAAAPPGAPAAPVTPANGAPAPEVAPDPREPQNAVQAILAKRLAKDAAAAKEAEQPSAPPGADGKTEPAKPDAPPTEDGKGLALKHAQLKADYRKTLADREALKAEHAAAVKERDEIKALFGPGKNHLQALEQLVGKPFKAIIEDAAKGLYDDKLPPEARAKIDKFEQWQAEEQAKAAAQKQQAARAEDEGIAVEYLGANAGKYPLFALNAAAARTLVNHAYAELDAGREPDLEAIAQQCEQECTQNLDGFFENAELMAALAKRPNVRQQWLKALGMTEGPSSNNAVRPASSTQGGSGAGNSSRTLNHTSTQESPVPPEGAIASEEEDRDQWLAGAQARLAIYRQHGRIGR